jgi:hypothetical protein
MRPNQNRMEMRICVESICKGVPREIAYAKKLRSELFESDEEFRVYFGLRENAPCLNIVCGA